MTNSCEETDIILSECVDIKQDLEAIGDGALHRLHERFDTLEDARRQYPVAKSLDDSIDWAAIQTAVSFHDNVHIPCGIYHLGCRSIDITHPVHLTGTGVERTILHYYGVDTAIWVNSPNIPTGSRIGGVYFWSVRDLTVNCCQRGHYGLRIGGMGEVGVSANNGKIESVRLTGAKEAGLHLIASQSNVFRDVYCSKNEGDGCRVDYIVYFERAEKVINRVKRPYCTFSKFYDCHFNKNGRHGISAGSGVGFSFHGCLFEENGACGVFMVRGQGALSFAPIDSCAVNDNCPEVTERDRTSLKPFTEDDIPDYELPDSMDSMFGILNNTPARDWEFARCWFERNSRLLEYKPNSEQSQAKQNQPKPCNEVLPDWNPAVFAHLCFSTLRVDGRLLQPWREMSIRDCRLNGQSIEGGSSTYRWNVVADGCHLNIWFPRTAKAPIGADTGTSHTKVTIWDYSHPIGRRTCAGGWMPGELRNVGTESPIKSKLLFYQINGRYYRNEDREGRLSVCCRVFAFLRRCFPTALGALGCPPHGDNCSKELALEHVYHRIYTNKENRWVLLHELKPGPWSCDA